MININLLDWRGKIRQINNNKFFIIMGVSAVFCMLLSSSSLIVIDTMTSNRKSDVKYLDDQLKEVEGRLKKIKGLQEQKDLILSRRALIEALQSNRPFVVKLFDNLVRVIPDGVVINVLTRNQDKLQILGTSTSNAQISALMKNIEQLKWVKSSTLEGITTVDTSQSDDNSKNPVVSSKIDFQLNMVLDSGGSPLPDATGEAGKNEQK